MALLPLGLENEIGSIEVGKKADLVLVDMKTPSLTPFRHPVSHVVYAANGGDVDTVICNGEILMRNKVLEVLDEAEVIQLAEDAAEELFIKKLISMNKLVLFDIDKTLIDKSICHQVAFSYAF